MSRDGGGVTVPGADPGGPEPARLADLVLVLADEMGSLGRAASDLQAELSPFGQAGRPGGDAVTALQSLDLLTQRLHGVADSCNNSRRQCRSTVSVTQLWRRD